MIETLRLLAATLWPALAAAAGTGLVFGIATCSGSPMGRRGRALVVLAITGLAAGLAASLLAWVPGRPGLWLDIGLLVAAAYLAGCLAGCLVQKALGRSLASAHEPRADAT